MSKKRELKPRKLIPPPEAADRIIKNDEGRIPKNPIKRFIKMFFFGEGY
jgi:hypothetical protein